MNPDYEKTLPTISDEDATASTLAAPVASREPVGAGHGRASGRYDHLREIALDCAFLLTQLGNREL